MELATIVQDVSVCSKVYQFGFLGGEFGGEVVKRRNHGGWDGFLNFLIINQKKKSHEIPTSKGKLVWIPYASGNEMCHTNNEFH